MYFLLNLKTAKPLKPTDIDESKGKEKYFYAKTCFTKCPWRKDDCFDFVQVHEELKTINAVYRQVQNYILYINKVRLWVKSVAFSCVITWPTKKDITKRYYQNYHPMMNLSLFCCQQISCINHTLGIKHANPSNFFRLSHRNRTSHFKHQ